MVVCKYFQQGSCRFGRSCRFEHVYSSKYSYNANQQQQAPPNPNTVDEQLIAQVITDTQSIIRGGQWVLSSYAPYKGRPNFPGLQDMSFEEARLLIYEAKARNDLDNAISFFNHLVKEARTKYEQLTQATPSTIKNLQTLYLDNIEDTSPAPSSATFALGGSNPAAALFNSAAQSASVFGQNTQSNVPNTNLFGGQSNQSNIANSSSIFGGQPSQQFGAQANQVSNAFGQQNSVFGQQNQKPVAQSIFAQANQSIFGQVNQPTASSLFAGAAQNAFGSNAFNQSQAVQPAASTSPFPNVFQQKTESHNVFGQTSQQSAVFENNQSNIFGQTNANSLGQSSSIFGQTTNEEEFGIYSKLEDLTGDDIEMYKSDDFKLGFIPELPPPKALCL